MGNMKRKIIKFFGIVLILAGGGVAGFMAWQKYMSPDVVPTTEETPVTTTNHKSHSNLFSRRQTSMPTECFDDKSPSVCSGVYDVTKTEQNTTCNCETVHLGKKYTKQYNIKTTLEYNLGFGEANAIADAVKQNQICDYVCDAFTDQIVNKKFLPREYFSVSHKCDDAVEITDKKESRFFSKCNCLISDENHAPTQFDMAKIKNTEFTEDTPENALAQCNRWCDRLCNSVFSTYIQEHPEFEIPIKK